jgi:hypothetical protein
VEAQYDAHKPKNSSRVHRESKSIGSNELNGLFSLKTCHEEREEKQYL